MNSANHIIQPISKFICRPNGTSYRFYPQKKAYQRVSTGSFAALQLNTFLKHKIGNFKSLIVQHKHSHWESKAWSCSPKTLVRRASWLNTLERRKLFKVQKQAKSTSHAWLLFAQRTIPNANCPMHANHSHFWRAIVYILKWLADGAAGSLLVAREKSASGSLPF